MWGSYAFDMWVENGGAAGAGQPGEGTTIDTDEPFMLRYKSRIKVLLLPIPLTHK